MKRSCETSRDESLCEGDGNNLRTVGGHHSGLAPVKREDQGVGTVVAFPAAWPAVEGDTDTYTAAGEDNTAACTVASSRSKDQGGIVGEESSRTVYQDQVTWAWGTAMGHLRKLGQVVVVLGTGMGRGWEE